MTRLNFNLEKTATGSRARATKFTTLHNEVLTPTFMPVGTHAAVRGQRREDLLEAGAQVLLANTYHLLLRPGVEVFRKFGGIHGFMNWPRSLLTDSGGFQIFCLPNSRVMKEDGAHFKSYVDGSTICLSPERSIETQKIIGSDIMMVLDQCVPSTVERPIAKAAMDLTHRWALRSLVARGESPQSVFGIVQGACYTDLRKESSKIITDMAFDGYAIGGLAVGESMSERQDCTATVTEFLPADRPRYLMGVGTTLDILEAVHRGVDMFDCILPTSMAQQGKAFTSIGRRDLRRGIYKDLEGPLDPACHCYTCKTYSLAYLYHLSRVHESQAWQLIGIHNIHFYMKLTRTMREHILNDTWLPFYNEQRLILDARDSYGPKSARYAKVDRAKSKLQLGRFEVVLDEDSARIRDLDSGNFIHGDLTHGEKGPAAEAGGLFVSASRILEKLTTPAADTSGLGPLILWDVGLGSAALAMKLVRAIEQAPPESLTRKLVMVSFEESNKLDALRLVLKYSARFKHAHHPGPARLHKHGQWKNQSGSITWNLMIGSFGQEIVGAPSPDVIFFNPSVFQADSEHWNLETLRALSKNRGARGLDIFTFTASDSVRGAFTEAGFRLATLIGANHQAEITIASIAPL